MKHDCVPPAIVMAVLVMLASAGCSPPPPVVFDSADSPDKRYTLTVTVAEPWMPHGKHTIAVFIRDLDSGVETMLIDARMENDGVPFAKTNIGLRWTGPTHALVCLRPTDLADKGIWIKTTPTPSAEIRDGC